MTVSELIAILHDYPPGLRVTVELEPEMFPDGVDLNELPGQWDVTDVEQENTIFGGNVLAIKL